jgi:glycosyltransferase involved in cell wall biosynthesis
LRLSISDLFLAYSGLQDINSPIRIRFEHTRFPHWGARSGYVPFVRHLDPQRFRTLLHGASDSDADLSRWLAPISPLLKRLIRRGRMPWYKLSDLNAELLAFSSCLAGQTDIVHFLDGEHSAQFLPRLVRLARLSKIRTVVTFHQPPQVAHELLRGDLLRWFDQVVLVSPSQLPFFLSCVPEDRLHVILHGVDIEFFRPRGSRPERSGYRCITVGHWLREWSVLRKIAGILTDMTFDVVTDRETDLGGLANVRIHRGLDDVALAELYRTADVLLLPLIDSTANNGLLEGIASGLPVVVTDLPAVRAYLPDGCGFFVPNNAVDGFVAALQWLKWDISLRDAMGLRARARAEELAWPRLVAEYEAVYARVLARPPSGSAEPGVAEMGLGIFSGTTSRSKLRGGE